MTAEDFPVGRARLVGLTADFCVAAFLRECLLPVVFLVAGFLPEGFLADAFLADAFFAATFFEAFFLLAFFLAAGFLRDTFFRAGFFFEAVFLPDAFFAGFFFAADTLREADFFVDFFAFAAFLVTADFLDTFRFLPAGFLLDGVFFFPTFFREAFAVLRFLLAVFLAGMLYSYRSEKNAQLYIAMVHMEAPEKAFCRPRRRSRKRGPGYRIFRARGR